MGPYSFKCNQKRADLRFCTNLFMKGGQEWEKLFKIFSNKSENFLRYETRRFLVEKTCKNKQW